MPRRTTRILIVLSFLAVAAPIRSAAGGGCHAVGMTDADTTRVVMAGNCFSPTIARVPAGAAVTWINKDAAGHTVTDANLSWGSMDELGAAKMVNVRFSRVGIYPYYCFIHPGMAGAIVVGDADHVKGAPGSTDVTTIRDESSVRLGVAKGAASGPAWPALTAAIGFVSGGLGFGMGRLIRSRRPGQAIGG